MHIKWVSDSMHLPRSLDSPIEFFDCWKKRIRWSWLVEEHLNIVGVSNTTCFKTLVRYNRRTLRGYIVEIEETDQRSWRLSAPEFEPRVYRADPVLILVGDDEPYCPLQSIDHGFGGCLTNIRGAAIVSSTGR